MVSLFLQNGSQSVFSMFRPSDSSSTAFSLDLWVRRYCNINWKVANKPFWFLRSFFAHPCKFSSPLKGSSTLMMRSYWRWRAPNPHTLWHGCGELSIFKIVFWYMDLSLDLVFGWQECMKFRARDATSNYIFACFSFSLWVSPLGSKWISISETNSLMSLLFSFRKHKNRGSEPLWSLGQRVCTKGNVSAYPRKLLRGLKEWIHTKCSE